jgi:hypothetical protein
MAFDAARRREPTIGRRPSESDRVPQNKLMSEYANRYTLNVCCIPSAPIPNSDEIAGKDGK